jgi:transposase
MSSSPDSSDNSSSVDRQPYQISDDVRRLVVTKVFDDLGSISGVAAELHLAKSTVHGIVRRFEESGTVERRKTGGNRRAATMTPEVVRALLLYIDSYPGATLRNAQGLLERRFHKQVSLSTISRALAGQHYCIKRMYSHSQERNTPSKIEQRYQWCQKNLIQEQVQFKDAVFIDEAGFNLSLTRRRGRAAPGQRAVQELPKQRGRNMSLIVGAVPSRGVVAASIHLGGTNKTRFAEWLDKELQPKLEHEGLEHCTLIMDNVKFHHSAEPAAAAAKHGHTILFIPTYTPHFNVAEWVFGSVKQRVSRSQAQSQNHLRHYIYAQLRRISTEKLQGYLGEARRWMEYALHKRPLPPTHDAQDALNEVIAPVDSSSSSSEANEDGSSSVDADAARQNSETPSHTVSFRTEDFEQDPDLDLEEEQEAMEVDDNEPLEQAEQLI